MSTVHVTASEPARLPLPPTKLELIAALQAASSAETLVRSFIERGKLDPDTFIHLCLCLNELRGIIGEGGEDMFTERWLSLRDDQHYADALPAGEIV